MKKFICLIASLLALMLCFSGCGEKASAVQVQRADALALALCHARSVTSRLPQTGTVKETI